MISVFVYGTLRRGYHNHGLLDGTHYVGEAVTKEHYGMFGNRIPFVNKNYALYPIHGEVYQVTPHQLKALDRLEGHPEWYHRERIQVVLKNSNDMVEAFIYFNDNHDNPFDTGNYAERYPIRQNQEQT